MSCNTARILVVEDEPYLCELVREELTYQGYACDAVTDPIRGMELLDCERFDLLVTDICMPGISGLELLAHARCRLPNCKVILITGHSNRDRLAQALILGAYDYLEKPFKTAEFLKIVTDATDGCAAPVLPAKAAAAMQLRSETKQASLDSIWALVRAVEAKDPYTRRHSEQVTYYAINFAEAMGLPESKVESIRVASLLHDVGKIGVPDSILANLGILTDEEFAHICRHPALGAEILSNVTMFSNGVYV